MFTFENWVFVIVWVLLTIMTSIGIVAVNEYNEQKWLYACVNFILSMIVLFGICIGIKWCNTNTASGIRAVKDFQSELSNGIDREITITAEDGREIFHYEGKVDIESNHTDNYIKFESEDGKRYIVYYGIQDTITIIEK